MKNRIQGRLPLHIISTHSTKELHITDYKDSMEIFGRSDVAVSESAVNGIHSVIITNDNDISICFDGFPENGLPLEAPGTQSKQCECVLFPDTLDDNHWILFIETKYANNFKNAFHSERNYPHSMINQVIETVQYFRNSGLIGLDKKVNALVSFPNLISEFSSTLFRGDLSIEDIFINHKIKIRAKNSAEVISIKRIKI